MKFGDLFLVGVFGAAAVAARRAMARSRQTPAERFRELMAREGFNPGEVLAATPPGPPPQTPPPPPPLVTRAKPYHTPHSLN